MRKEEERGRRERGKEWWEQSGEVGWHLVLDVWNHRICHWGMSLVCCGREGEQGVHCRDGMSIYLHLHHLQLFHYSQQQQQQEEEPQDHEQVLVQGVLE